MMNQWEDEFQCDSGQYVEFPTWFNLTCDKNRFEMRGNVQVCTDVPHVTEYKGRWDISKHDLIDLILDSSEKIRSVYIEKSDEDKFKTCGFKLHEPSSFSGIFRELDKITTLKQLKRSGTTLEIDSVSDTEL